MREEAGLIKDIEKGWQESGNEFVKKVQLTMAKLVHDGKKDLAGIAQSAVMQAFNTGASCDDLKLVPMARVCVTSEGQRQGWFALWHQLQLVAVATEDPEEFHDELSDDLELTFFVDTDRF